MYLIAGLGNPGREYENTRHNIGFEVVNELVSNYHIPLDFKKHKAICGKGCIQGQKVILAKPQTYMNLSGESIKELVDYYKIAEDEIIIIYDDISLDIGQIRIRSKGSAGGHNGMKSIIKHLGTEQFSRIKVGIGDKPRGWDLADYVLGKFLKEEQGIVQETVKRVADACEIIITAGLNDAMNQYNKKR